jgi:tripartite-type tricarboxylate transporter receptor subunit TctC
MAAAPLVRSASAEAAWPNRPVSVMVPYPPAGGADTTARILNAKVGTILGQQFVIENRGKTSAFALNRQACQREVGA